jgi:hypothetical protein
VPRVIVRKLPDDVVVRLRRERRALGIPWGRSSAAPDRRHGPGAGEGPRGHGCFRAMTPKVPQTDAAMLIREDRDLGWR